VEVFSGAANLLFCKPPSKTEVINDINADLVNLFRVVRFHPREFLAQLSTLTHSRVEFADARTQPGLTDIQRAVSSYLVFKMAFGGAGGTSHPAYGYGTTGRSKFRRTAFSLVRQVHKRLDGVHIENLDFADCIRRYDRSHTFFYCDPPYHDTGGYRNAFDWPDHLRLAETLRSIKGKFLLSINDHPDIRKLYRGLTKRKVNARYTIARDKSAAARNRTELIIANYPLPRRR